MNGGTADIIAIVLIVVLGLTATVDFMRHPKAIEFTTALRIPPRAVPVLGAVKAAAAVGLVLGMDRVRIGELTGACLVAYFAIAALTHVRAKQGVVGALPAVILMCASAAYLAATVAR